jgi:hypothetical protein
MNPADFYQLGVKLISGSQVPDAAACRTAIGRAYYAALNRADEALARWGASCGKGPQKHGLAIRFLHATGDPDLKMASSALDRLRGWRNSADYDMNEPSVENVPRAQTALDLAQEVLDYLDAVDNDAARRTSAETQIKSYKLKTNTP